MDSLQVFKGHDQVLLGFPLSEPSKGTEAANRISLHPHHFYAAVCYDSKSGSKHNQLTALVPPPCQVSNQNCPLSHTQNAVKGHWIHSVIYHMPGHISELLLWISLHRAQAGFALPNQQQHYRQMYSKRPLVIKGTARRSARPKKLGLPFACLSRAV